MTRNFGLGTRDLAKAGNIALTRLQKRKGCSFSSAATNLEGVDESDIGSRATAKRQEREQRKRDKPEQVFDDGERSGFHAGPNFWSIPQNDG